MERINALLVYPEFPPSYWGMQNALRFVRKKTNMPPLGLLTVAGMFPSYYNLCVVDMNVERLTDAHLARANVVFTSSMIVQHASLQHVVARCNARGIPVVAGGPYPTSYFEEIEGVTHFVLGEVEGYFEQFLRDFEEGRAKHIYKEPAEKPSVTQTPAPRYDLIKLRRYGSMALQFSRGCPFDCEFCDITKLFGRVPRTKTNEQMLKELQLLFDLGWRGSLFLVDDNFIGNRRDAMRLLPAIAEWQKAHGYPFGLFTEASVNLAEHPELLEAMADAGFHMVFMGIESPNPLALLETKKGQNVKAGQDDYLLHAIRAVQAHGIEVTAGFIVGLDGDDEASLRGFVPFIQKAGIPVAMAGLLAALKGTDLYKRLAREGRLLVESLGNNVSFQLNFVPRLDPAILVDTYRRILTALYDPSLKNYFARCLTLFEHTGRVRRRSKMRITWREVMACVKSLALQMPSRQGPAYARFLASVTTKYPSMIPEAIRLAIMGYHFEKVTRHQVAVHAFQEFVEKELAALQARRAELTNQFEELLQEVENLRQRVNRRYRRLHRDCHVFAEGTLEKLHSALEQVTQPRIE